LNFESSKKGKFMFLGKWIIMNKLIGLIIGILYLVYYFKSKSENDKIDI